MPGFVQSLGSVASSSATTTLVLTLPTITTTPVGDYVFVVVQGNASASWTMTDSRANTYTLDTQQTTAAPFVGIFKAQIAAGKQLVTGDTITWTTTSQGGRTLNAASYTGLLSGTLNQSGVANGVSASALTVTAAGANSQPDTLVISGVSSIATSTGFAATGYAVRSTVTSSGTIHTGVIGDRLTTAGETSSAAWTWTTAGTNGAAIATYALLPNHPSRRGIVYPPAQPLYGFQ